MPGRQLQPTSNTTTEAATRAGSPQHATPAHHMQARPAARRQSLHQHSCASWMPACCLRTQHQRSASNLPTRRLRHPKCRPGPCLATASAQQRHPARAAGVRSSARRRALLAALQLQQALLAQVAWRPCCGHQHRQPQQAQLPRYDSPYSGTAGRPHLLAVSPADLAGQCSRRQGDSTAAAAPAPAHALVPVGAGLDRVRLSWVQAGATSAGRSGGADAAQPCSTPAAAAVAVSFAQAHPTRTVHRKLEGVCWGPGAHQPLQAALLPHCCQPPSPSWQQVQAAARHHGAPGPAVNELARSLQLAVQLAQLFAGGVPDQQELSA
jgi:hypothetical protein